MPKITKREDEELPNLRSPLLYLGLYLDNGIQMILSQESMKLCIKGKWHKKSFNEVIKFFQSK